MNLTILEVAVGISFLFFIVSVVASAINEAIAGIWNVRATMLEKGIVNLLTGKAVKRDSISNEGEDGSTSGDTPKALVERLFDHSLITGYSRNNKLPSYLASRTFRNALFDVTGLFAITETKNDPLAIEDINRNVQAGIAKLPNKHLRESLLTIWNGVDHDVTEFRAGVERWFDRAMERVGGWYKRRAQIFLFVIGLLLAFAINANSVSAAGHLWNDDAKRESVVAVAQNVQPTLTADDAILKLDDVGFPIGWEKANQPDTVGQWGLALVGWLITGFAVTLGAPFWFDVLNKVSNLRSAGRKPDSSLIPSPTKAEVANVNLNVSSSSPLAQPAPPVT